MMTEERVRALCDRINLCATEGAGPRLFWVAMPSTVGDEYRIAAGWAHDLPDACRVGASVRGNGQTYLPRASVRTERDLLWRMYWLLSRLAVHEVHHWLLLDGVPLVDPVAEEDDCNPPVRLPPLGWCPDLEARLAQPPPPKPHGKVAGAVMADEWAVAMARLRNAAEGRRVVP